MLKQLLYAYSKDTLLPSTVCTVETFHQIQLFLNYVVKATPVREDMSDMLGTSVGKK